MHRWHPMTEQGLSCKFYHTLWLLNNCIDAIFHWRYFLNLLWTFTFHSFIFFAVLFCLFLSLILMFCFLPYAIRLSLIPLFLSLLAHDFSLVLIDFTLSKFIFCFSASLTLFLWFLLFSFLPFEFLFEHFIFDFLLVFSSLTLF